MSEMVSFDQNDWTFITVWKFHDFSITQILREINFEDSRSAKTAILTHLEALNFAIFEGRNLQKQQNSKPLKVKKKW